MSEALCNELHDLSTADEATLRDKVKAPWLDDMAELVAYIQTLTKRSHDYGTCVYAMSLSAQAAFNYVSGKLGVTGFQASCAEMDFIRRTRGMKSFRITNYDDLLYPQYLTKEKFPSLQDLLDNKEMRARLREEAKALIAEKDGFAAPSVLAWWKALASHHEYINVASWME